MEMKAFNVGDIACNPSDDETKFDLTDGGAILILKFRNPTETEIQDVKSGETQFKLAMKDGIIFFLAKFGESNWIDAPYYRELSQYTLQRPKEGFGLMLHVLLVDAATGKLASQRIIGLSTKFSWDLLDTVFQQPKFASAEEYLQTLQRVYKSCATSELLKNAISSN